MAQDDFDSVLRSAGYVSSGLNGSRGDYFIFSYRPGARAKKKLPAGLVEVHICRSMKLFHITTPRGQFDRVNDAVQALKKQ